MQAIATPAPIALWLSALPAVLAWPLRLALVAVLAVLSAALWVPQFFGRVVLAVLGLLAVPVGLLYRVDHADTARPFTDAESSHRTWRLVTLPAWAWLWSNDRDGALGDRRGWWDRNAPLGLGAYHFLSMAWWLLIRNPVGNMRYLEPFALCVTVTRAVWFGRESVEDDPGQGGFRFLLAWRAWRVWAGLYWVKEYRLPAWLVNGAERLARRWPRLEFVAIAAAAPRALVVQLGNKAEPSDWREDYQGDPSRAWKGATFEVNPWKNIL